MGKQYSIVEQSGASEEVSGSFACQYSCQFLDEIYTHLYSVMDNFQVRVACEASV